MQANLDPVRRWALGAVVDTLARLTGLGVSSRVWRLGVWRLALALGRGGQGKGSAGQSVWDGALDPEHPAGHRSTVHVLHVCPTCPTPAPDLCLPPPSACQSVSVPAYTQGAGSAGSRPPPPPPSALVIDLS